MNNAAFRRFVESRCQDTQFHLRFGLVAGRNCQGQPFVLAFQCGQNTLVQLSALVGLSFALSGRSCVRHIVRFRKSTETITSLNPVNPE